MIHKIVVETYVNERIKRLKEIMKENDVNAIQPSSDSEYYDMMFSYTNSESAIAELNGLMETIKNL